MRSVAGAVDVRRSQRTEITFRGAIVSTGGAILYQVFMIVYHPTEAEGVLIAVGGRCRGCSTLCGSAWQLSSVNALNEVGIKFPLHLRQSHQV